MSRNVRKSWKDSNLALIGSDLDHSIKAAAAAGEPAWSETGKSEGTLIWRVEHFKVVEWPKEKYGKFHTGDSYIVLHTYKKGNSQALNYDVHFWIGKESSQDEYGTAAYKTVELDDHLGGAPIQHREVQGHESPLFLSYFKNVTYLDGGVDTGFRHVEASKDQPHLYKVKGTVKSISMTQVPLSKSSMNQGDSFILFANHSSVWVWHGQATGREEKVKAIDVAKQMCTEGTVVVIDSSEPEESNAEFWAYLEDGEIRKPEAGDDEVQQYVPVLLRVEGNGKTTKVAEGKPVNTRWGPPIMQLDRSVLDDESVYFLDAGFQVFMWLGKASSKEEKLAAMEIADKYMKDNVLLSDLPLTIVKSGRENTEFDQYFK